MRAMKPIETVYQGYRFRSRLEARWAVFFDALGVRYEYEKEGFDLGEAGYYLPDFWLPEYSCWVEIKGADLTDRETQRAGLLAASSGLWVDVMIGAPGDHTIWAFKSRRPEHNRIPMDYIERALAEKNWWVLEAIIRAYDRLYWNDIAEQAKMFLPDDPRTRYFPLGKPGDSFWMFPRDLGLCPHGHLVWMYTSVMVCESAYHECSLCGDVQSIHSGERAAFPGFGYCYICHDDDAEGDTQHPLLLAAYTAARQARFEHGETPR